MADFVGYLALAIMVFALVRKDSKHLLPLVGIGVFLWGGHYWLIGSTSGAVVHMIAGVGIFVAHSLFHARLSLRIALASTFSALGVYASLYSGITLEDSVAAIGCIVMTASQYVFRGIRMRQGFLIGEAIFFVFAFMVGSIPGMLVTTANGVAGLIGLIRIHRAKQQSGTTNTRQRAEQHAA